MPPKETPKKRISMADFDAMMSQALGVPPIRKVKIAKPKPRRKTARRKLTAKSGR